LSTDTANAIGCYEDLGGPQIAGCTCHSSCRACGYNDAPTDADDCITCADGSTVEAVYDDGTGRCAVAPPTAAPTETPTELAPPTAAPTLGPTTAPQRVYASISFSTLDYSSLTAQAQATFQSEFIQLVAAEAGVEQSAVTITNIVAGSTVVTFTVLSPSVAAATTLSDTLTNSVSSVFASSPTFSTSYGVVSSSGVAVSAADGPGSVPTPCRTCMKDVLTPPRTCWLLGCGRQMMVPHRKSCVPISEGGGSGKYHTTLELRWGRAPCACLIAHTAKPSENSGWALPNVGYASVALAWMECGGG